MTPYAFGKLAALKQAGFSAQAGQVLDNLGPALTHGMAAGGVIGGGLGAYSAPEGHRLQGAAYGAGRGMGWGGLGSIGGSLLRQTLPMSAIRSGIGTGLASGAEIGGLLGAGVTGYGEGQQLHPLERLKARLHMG